MKPRIPGTVLTLLILLCSIHIHAQHHAGRMLDTIYDQLISRYADKLDSTRLARTGIDAMMKSMDPFTNYMDAAEAAEFNFSLNARYGGIGIGIRTYNNETTIREIFKHYPGDRAGLKTGDILLSIDGKSLKGIHVFDVFPMLRGEPGSTIKLQVFRPFTKQTLDFTITREEITLPSVPYYGIVGNTIGYIKLEAETKGSADEVLHALKELKTNNVLDGLILDLRGNIGGYMREAIRIANFFLDKGKPLISQKSWYSDTSYLAMDDPIDTELPLVLLVDSATVSSGEILAGALQDNDRAVLIGQTTFGKGMVQELFPLSNGGLSMISTGYYHTSSGRCIQRKDYSVNKSGDLIADSLKRTFTTGRGRKLLDHDGISPDIKLKVIPVSPVVTALNDDFSENGELLFNYVRKYLQKYPSAITTSGWKVSDIDYNDFVSYMIKGNFNYALPSEEKLKMLEQSLKADGITSPMLINNISAQIQKEKTSAFTKEKTQIRTFLEQEIISHNHYHWGREEARLKTDPAIKVAVEVISNKTKYSQLLGY